MSRISKTDVNKALTLAAKAIKDAGGADGRTSRAELKKAVPALPEEQRALVETFFKFIDHRDFKRGAQVTKADVDRAVKYAKEKLIARYDLDNNGLSQNEIAKMSLTGKLAVDLAKKLKAAGEKVDPPRLEEGLSEPEEIIAAGQVPRDWEPAVHLTKGTILNADGQYTGFRTSQKLPPQLRAVADAAFATLWPLTLQYREEPGTPLPIGDSAQGTLKLGEFTRSTDGKTYLVADWRDIDDASYTLYFEKLKGGKLRLAVQQYNN